MALCDTADDRRRYQREYMRRKRADPEYREQEQARRRARRAEPGYAAAEYARRRARLRELAQNPQACTKCGCTCKTQQHYLYHGLSFYAG